MDSARQKIIDLFLINVKGKKAPTSLHDGSEGHWLEKQMGVSPNNRNEPDIFGYEMKKESSKITFGDFSASEYLFSKRKPLLETLNQWNTDEIIVKRDEFITYFGAPNIKKNNRYSWSGRCFPTYGTWNSCGQMMYFNNNLDLIIYYSFEQDSRPVKVSYPKFLQKEIVAIAIWEKKKLETNINRKFNNKGFFICKKINNTYKSVCFGKPFDFNYFSENIKNKNIILDSGMYAGNTRNYSSFRSSSKFWNSLLV